MKNIISIFMLIILQNCVETQSEVKKIAVKKNDTVEITKSASANVDSLYIFSPYEVENDGKNKIFISLSDIYKDTITIPPDIIKNQNNIPFSKLKHLELPPYYRRKLLEGTGLKETDSLFLFNYKSGKLATYVLKDLKSVANLNVYSSEREHVEDYYFMIGFELKDVLNEKEKLDGGSTLAYFGKNNPFSNKPLTKIKWKEILREQFPVQITKNDSLTIKGTYKYIGNDANYYIQDWKSDDYLERRFLVITDKKDQIKYRKTFDNRGEGSALTQLNYIEDSEYTDYQWTGKLFKNKPAVIFDLLNESFACPEIIFIDPSYPSITINCDNRH